MNRRTLLATLVAVLGTPAVAGLVIAPVAVLAMPAVALAASGPLVNVRVEGLRHSLLRPTNVHTGTGWITRFGAPRGECSAKSAQGALNVATHRRWHGIWSTEFGPEYEINSILGEKHNFHSNYFWEIFANNIAAPAGACELTVHRGEHLVFAAVPQHGTVYTMGLKAPRNVTAGQQFWVKAVWFNPKGRAVALAHAVVSGGGLTATTNQNGIAYLTAAQSGKLVLRARHAWSASFAYVRSAPVTVNVS